MASVSTGTSEETASAEAQIATSATSSTETGASTASKQTVTTLASTEVKLSNGHVKSLGFIHNVWIDAQGRRYLTIDYCDVFYGDAATAAARAAGVIGPDEEVPVYVRNQSTRLREWLIADGAALVTCTRAYPLDSNPDPPCTWSEFVSFWKAGVQSSLDQGISDFYGAPWWIERSGDTVVKITEQFIS